MIKTRTSEPIGGRSFEDLIAAILGAGSTNQSSTEEVAAIASIRTTGEELALTESVLLIDGSGVLS